MKSATLSQAIDGFLLEKAAQHLSPGTVADYSNAYRRFRDHFATDPRLSDVSAEQVRTFLAALSQPQDIAGIVPRKLDRLSNKTIRNIHTALSALWTWAVQEGYCKRHVPHEIARPKAETRAIVPLTQADLRSILAAAERTTPYSRPGKRECSNARPTALRDRSIVLLLVDTGIRASELCGLSIRDVDLKNRRIQVLGKGSKERALPISASTAKAVWRYLQSERKDDRVNEPLFITRRATPLSRSALLDLVEDLGRRAGVPGCHPHRFRHTFAVTFLRNGGNAYALQMALGHTTLEMVKTYLSLAEADLDAVHKTASPVDNWRL